MLTVTADFQLFVCVLLSCVVLTRALALFPLQLRERLSKLKDAVSADPVLGRAIADGVSPLAIENGRPLSRSSRQLLPPVDGVTGPATE